MGDEMYNLDKISEVMYEIDSKPQLKQQLIQKSGWYNGNPLYKIAHLVFSGAADNIRIIYFRAWQEDVFLEKIKPFKEALRGFLDECANPGLADLVVFMQIYPHRLDYIQENENRGFPEDDALDSLLRETRGVLLWEYQLDMVIKLFAPDLSIPEVIQLSKALQLGNKEAIDRSRKLKREDATLYDVVTERSIYNCSVVAGSPTTTLDKALELYVAIKEVDLTSKNCVT
jgi:hypothetical protein